MLVATDTGLYFRKFYSVVKTENILLLSQISQTLVLEDYKDIINECASGNVLAQEKLYRLLAPEMFGVCLRYARNRAEAEDNLQDGFIKVFKNIKKYRHEGSFGGWVRRIMVNVSLTKYRKQHVLHPVEELEQYEASHMSEDITGNLEAEKLMELVQQLPPRYRMVFNLYAIEGMSHQEISEVMNISPVTSRSNLTRARDILKRKVQELYSEMDFNAK